jgi:hypothetical protein
MSTTARTLTYLRRLGFTVHVVERWLSRADVRHDLFGIGDIIGDQALGRQGNARSEAARSAAS